MAPQVFVQLGRKHKIAYALFGLVFLVPVFLPFYRYLFWAFAGDYYRLYSVFVAFVFLFFSLHALHVLFKTGRVGLNPDLFSEDRIAVYLDMFPDQYPGQMEGFQVPDGKFEIQYVLHRCFLHELDKCRHADRRRCHGGSCHRRGNHVAWSE